MPGEAMSVWSYCSSMAADDGHLHLPDPFDAPWATCHFNDKAFFDKNHWLKRVELILELFTFVP
ncbi:MAG TPA: hypothetical protein VEX68_16250 [Bryobacteraceae bacterium]|nr:hypothetical protein [Bryobacteraceae bacterium]